MSSSRRPLPCRLAEIALLALLLAGCAPLASAPPARGAGEATGLRTVFYRCDDGERIEVRFFALQGVAVLVRDGRTLELQQVPAGSGFAYEGAAVRLQGQGEALTLSTPVMPSLACRVLR